MTAYRTIFLAPAWLHVRHLKWSDAWPDPELRIMSRQNGPISRFLVVSAIPPEKFGLLEEELKRRANVFAEITVHDLTGSADLAALLAKMGYAPLEKGRMLNNFTMVCDLSQDEASLLEAMNADSRRKLRRAEQAGVEFVCQCGNNSAERARFLTAYNRMADERALAPMSAGELDVLLASGSSRLAAAYAADRAAVTYVLTYEADGIAVFHHGASDGPSDAVLGRAVHWGLVRCLKAEGFAWYDLGGLPTLDPVNGITRFKLGFGWSIVDLGREYRRSGAIVRLARRVRRLFGR